MPRLNISSAKTEPTAPAMFSVFAGSAATGTRRLGHFSKLAVFLVVLVMPGSLLVVPLLAWWFRGRNRRGNNRLPTIDALPRSAT